MSRSTGTKKEDVEVLGGSKYPSIVDCTISSCVTKYNDEKESDMVYITLQPMKEGEKPIKLDSVCRASKSDAPFIKENHKRLANLLFLLNPNKPDGEDWLIENKLTSQYSWETKKDELVMMENYVEFLDKPVKALVTLRNEFRKIKVNGYSGKAIVSKRENEADWKIAIESPETIEIPDYSKNEKGFEKRNFIYDCTKFYDYETGKTLLELNKDMDAIQAEKDLASAKKVTWKEEKKTPAELLEYRKEKLIKSLTKAGKEFNETLWNELNQMIDDVPFNSDEIDAFN